MRQQLSFEELASKNPSRNESYSYCHYYFRHFLAEELRLHRKFFSTDGRGFGEDAFHVMWFLLFQEFRPSSALEIGVYRGQTITLWKLLSRHLRFPLDVGCISPFSDSGDSVSRYRQRLDYYEDVVRNHQHFGLSMPTVCRHFSTATEAREFIAQRSWSVIYIDGNHDYEIVSQDWEVCSRSVAIGGLIVLDDASLGTDYRPYAMISTAGHPGPSRLAGEIDPGQFLEILAVGHNRVFRRVA